MEDQDQGAVWADRAGEARRRPCFRTTPRQLEWPGRNDDTSGGCTDALDPDLPKKERGGASLAELALIDNIQREDLNPVEEGEAYNELIRKHHWTEKQLGDRLGKAQSFISDKIRLTALDDRVKKLIKDGNLSFSQARQVARVKDRAEQAKLARSIAAENMTVLEAKALVDEALGKSEAPRAATGARLSAFSPKRAIGVLGKLDQGLRLLKPDKIKERWRKDLLKNVDTVLERLQALRKGLAARK